jgi:hypothetical protein
MLNKMTLVKHRDVHDRGICSCLLQDYNNARGDSRFEMNTFQHFRLWADDVEDADQQKAAIKIDTSLRFKLLQARNENISEFKDYRSVPPYDYLVRKDRPIFKVK